MKPNEALLLKIYDSKARKEDDDDDDGDGVAVAVAGGTPHASFTLPGSENCETRNSIELRCLVFYDC